MSLSGRVVSAALVLYFRDTVYVPFASSRPEVLQPEPEQPALLGDHPAGLPARDRGAELRALPAGFEHLDFKLRFGAVVAPIPFYIHALRDTAPAIDPNEEGVRRLRAIVGKSCPDGSRTWCGPEVCKRFLV